MTRGICALALALSNGSARGTQPAIEVPIAAGASEISAGDGGAPQASGRRQLADDPPHLRWLGLQSAGADHAGQRRALKPVWVFATGETRAHESAPIVNNGVMFVTTPMNQVIAIDAKSGNLLWRYRRKRPDGPRCLTKPIAESRFTATRCISRRARPCWWLSMRRRARKCGPRRWPIITPTYYMTLAPLVAGGAVMVGVSGGEFGVRGFVAAFHPETGKELWRTYTVPAPGEPGSETWPKGDEWKTGGAPVWVTGNYDPETNLAYFGTGNGGPTVGDNRPGDNLYTASTLALDVATGAIKGYFQYHPNDSWDYDEVSPPILVDYQRNGRTVKGLVDVARDGYMWFLDRSGWTRTSASWTPSLTSIERVQEHRSCDGASGHRSRTHAWHRQARRFLSRIARWEKPGRPLRSVQKRA